jgi:hypothetical protein
MTLLLHRADADSRVTASSLQKFVVGGDQGDHGLRLDMVSTMYDV